MTNDSVKPPVWFWIVSGIALIWNGMGVSAYLMQAYMTAEDLAALPEAEQALYVDFPAWATAAFAIAVFAGTLGCLLLLLRKKLAYVVLVLSLVGIIIQMIYNIFIGKAMDVYGPGAIIMPVMVLAVGLGLIRLAKKATTNGWLN
ncbi:MAG: hypothetical protein ABJP45_07485 [Cyclobacteriaceae bacterium]